MKKAIIKSFLLLCIIFLISISAIGFVACDSGDKPSDKTFAFAEGTTVSDILNMFDNGKIESCTLCVGQKYADGYVYTYKCSPKIWYTSLEGKEEWNIYDFEENRVYIIKSDYTKDDYVWYELEDGDNPIAKMRAILDKTHKTSGVGPARIDSKSVTMTMTVGVDGAMDYVWSDFNDTQALLPLKYADFKEHAKQAVKLIL